jgi:transcription elongation factor Elf1
MELKPCPFCGSNQVQLCIDSNNAMKDRAKCRECGITGLVSAWNRRTAPDRDAVIEECAKACEDLSMHDGSLEDLENERCVKAIRSLKHAPTASQLAALDRLAENAHELGLGYDTPTDAEGEKT